VHISAGTRRGVAAAALGRRRGLERPADAARTTCRSPCSAPASSGSGGSASTPGSASPRRRRGQRARHHRTPPPPRAARLARARAARGGPAVGRRAATGAVVGLVAITPAAGFVTPAGALAIGALAAPRELRRAPPPGRTGVDDALDVFACHGVAGIVGALLTGVFATRTVNPAGADGLLAGNAALVGVQALAVGVTVVFAGGLTAGILALVGLVAPLRVQTADEIDGVDLSEHGESAYHGDAVDLAGRGVPLGGSVYLPPDQLAPFGERRPVVEVAA
jgi:Amt family ammonium transporter